MSDEVVEKKEAPAQPAAAGAPQGEYRSEAPRERPQGGPRGEGGPRGDRGGDRGDRGGPRGGGDRGDRGGPGGRKRRFPRRKVCYFRAIKAEYVDYKDVNTLRRFVTEEGKILPRRVTGTTAKFQRALTLAIKRARFMALIPYCKRHR
ncbi:MAG: 30S ribosomal protein S18 [Candidatus Sumerlaeia bacterium]|nr:30S ribosomal protein S18 [Candidatus Sumerlaeia bacterium]